MLTEWLIQFGPISTFFITFKLSGNNFFLATLVLMVGIIVGTTASVIRDRRLPWFPLYTAFFTLFFGGATLYFRDPHFLMVRDTFYDGIFGIVILIALSMKQNILKTFFLPLFALTERGWQVLAWRWAVFFLVMSTANEIVRHLVSPEIWVYFKVLSTVTFIVFGVYQLTLTHRERLPEESNRLGMRR
ncbi:hypothetical protein E6Q11_00350 [Candidatus Dojkabacteria bacterium]|uniref:Intracellular septation protein A n=1 Tax=Candidatus Dojkabacteria bacterium TaxID=2099670 RepID=A0A5C7JB58_9BACT|nr:MAG: hypothetical protein E6Q11_00350 [Candidatus Dojkabacteria bacterium]